MREWKQTLCRWKEAQLWTKIHANDGEYDSDGEMIGDASSGDDDFQFEEYQTEGTDWNHSTSLYSRDIICYHLWYRFDDVWDDGKPFNFNPDGMTDNEVYWNYRTMPIAFFANRMTQ